MEFDEFKQWVHDIIGDNTMIDGDEIGIINEKDFDQHCYDFYNKIHKDNNFLRIALVLERTGFN